MRNYIIGIIGIASLLLFMQGCGPGVRRYEHKGVPAVIGREAVKQDYFCASCEGRGLRQEDNIGAVYSFDLNGRKIKVLCLSEWLQIDEKAVRMPLPTRCETGKVFVSKALLSYVKNIGRIKQGRPIRVMIDPGHGGKDPGAIGNGLKEKDIVLDIAHRLKRYLVSSGAEVRMTRDKDVYITLKRRAYLANKWAPDVFVSIHANSSRNPGGRGIEVYYVSEKVNDTNRAVVSQENGVLDIEGRVPDSELKVVLWDMIHTENRAESRRLARKISQKIARIMQSPDRGAKGAPFYVLKWVNAPSVLIEVGFVSNPQEASRLASPGYRDRIARAIFEGLISYFEELRIQ